MLRDFRIRLAKQKPPRHSQVNDPLGALLLRFFFIRATSTAFRLARAFRGRGRPGHTIQIKHDMFADSSNASNPAGFQR